MLTSYGIWMSLRKAYPSPTHTLPSRASLVYQIIVQFLQDFYETILVGKFQSRDIGEKCASRRSLIITQLYPINRNFTGSHCNTIAKLNAAPHGRCYPANLHDSVHEVVLILPQQSGTGWYVGQSNTVSCVRQL